jgi:hypothetical protein
VLLDRIVDEARNFHYAPVCAKIEGPRGGVKFQVERWRRNGRTQRWKTRPGEFRIPVKFGLRTYGAITDFNQSNFHAAEDCPVEELRY